MNRASDRELALGRRPRADYPGTEVYASAVVHIGLFRCPTDHPNFAHEGRPRGHIAVFPRTPVRIVHPGRGAVVADPTTVMFYNRGQEYRREPLSQRGDRCEWFALAEPLLLEAIARHDPAVVERTETPFDRTSGPAADGVYALQRGVVEHIVGSLRRGAEPDRMWVDEACLELFRRLLGDAMPTPAGTTRTRPATWRAHRELVHRTTELLATRAHEPLNIDDIATRVAASPFHLCRVFRAWTGRSLHEHVTRLRLRDALERLTGRGSDLAAIAAATGFASHSHFTATFRRVFGITPSELRDAIAAPSPRALAARLFAC